MNLWNGNCHSRVSGLVLHGAVILEQIFFMETVIFKNALEGLKKEFLIKVKLLHNVILKKCMFRLMLLFFRVHFHFKICFYLYNLTSLPKQHQNVKMFPTHPN